MAQINFNQNNATIIALNSLKSSLDADEKAIVSFIVSSIRSGIISTATVDSDDYYSFTFAEDAETSKKSYKVCFGKNPDKLKHPNAERGVRASDFVTRLFNIKDSKYNCFIVPHSIGTPDPQKIKNRFFSAQGKGFTVEALREVSNSSEIIPDNSIFELDVVIVATIGQRCERFDDSIVAHIERKQGRQFVTYAYENHTKPQINMEMSDDEREKTQERANTFLNLINGSQNPDDKNKHKRAMLSIFAKDPSSKFGQYLRKCEAENGDIGQVSIRPSSIYVNISSQKVFSCPVKIDKYGSTSFSLTWDKSTNEFDDSDFYINVSRNGDFIGLTSLPQNAEKQRLERFDPKTDALIPVFALKEKKTVVKKITLVNKEILDMLKAQPNKVDGLSDELKAEIDALLKTPHKGVLNENVVYVEKATDPFMANQFYTADSTILIDNEFFLSADVSNCAYDGQPCWNGHLTVFPQAFPDPEGKKLIAGKIRTSYVSKGHERFCPFCENKFYADEARYNRYISNHRFAHQGLYYCEKCTPTQIYGDYKFKNDVYNTEKTAKGKAYVRVNAAGRILSPEENGNVFWCSECNEYIIYDKTKDVKCDLCGARMCNACKKTVNARRNNRVTTKQGIKHFCKACPSIGKRFPANTPNAGKRLLSVYDKSEQNNYILLYDDSIADNVFTCGTCGKQIFTESQARNLCGCCGKEIGDSCFNNTKITPIIDVKLCKDCTDETKSQAYVDALNELSATEKEITAVQKARDEKLKQVAEYVKEEVYATMAWHAKYFSPADQKTVRRLLKHNIQKEEHIKVEIENLTVYSNGSFTAYYYVWSDYGKKYHFYVYNQYREFLGAKK